MGVTAFKMPVGGAWESPGTLLFPNIDARQIAAYAHEQYIHAHGLYDVEVDTGALSPSDCTQRVERALQADDNTAFNTLRAKTSAD